MQAFLILRILWGALAFSTVVCLVPLQFIEPQGGPPTLALLLGLGAAAVCIAAASLAVPRVFYGAAVLRATIPTREEPNPMGMPGVAKRLVAADPEAALRTVLPAFQTAFVLQMALAEAIAMLGFVLGFLGYTAPTYLGFFVASWALAAYHFPTAKKVLRPVERLKGIRVPQPS
jgi:hypothetical protein